MIFYSQDAKDLRDRLHVIVKNFREAFPDNFENSGLKICPNCQGTGLPVKKGENSDITFWEPGTYCDSCSGIGFLGAERIYNKYLCKFCKGNGCKKCRDSGLVDWVTHAMGR